MQRIPTLTNYLVVAIDEQLRDYCVEVSAAQLQVCGAAPELPCVSSQVWTACCAVLRCTTRQRARLCRHPLAQHGINHYYRPVVIPDSQKDTGSNHAISAMKCAAL